MFTRASLNAIKGLRSSLKTSARALSTRSSIQVSRKFPTTLLGALAIGSGAYIYSLSSDGLIQNEAAPLSGVKGTSSERTFIAVKPDGVQRGLVGEIISRFEKRGYKLVALKVVVPSKELAKEHYADLSSKPFFGGLVDYMTNGKAPVVAMVWEGLDVIKQGRSMIGATNPLDASAGSIRGDHCISVGRNIIHGSDSYESATKEIELWFGKPGDIVNWTSALGEWIFSNN